MKRITTLIAMIALLTSMILPISAANDHTKIDSNHAHCSTGGNIIDVVVNGNTVKISGKLVYVGLDMIWLLCGDTTYINLPTSKLVPISAGEYFSVTLDVSGLTEESEIRILYSVEGMDSFYYHHDHALYSIKPSANGWQLYASPNRKHEGNEGELDAVLDVFTSNAAYINAPVAHPDTVKTITTNTTDNNHVTVTIEGNKAIISGSVVYDNLSNIWCRCDETNKVGLPSSKLIDAASGKPFSVELDLSGITEPTYIDVLALTAGDTTAWHLYWHHFLVNPTADGYALSSAPLLKHNIELQKQWINLADTFDSHISDAVQKKSDEICAGITDDYSKLWALYQWVAKNVYYDFDCFLGLAEGVHEPDDVLRTKTAVCQGYAELLEAFIEAQGIPAIISYDYAAGVTDDIDFWDVTELPLNSNHTHVEAFVDMRWVTMDATWDSKNEYYQGKYEPHNPTSWEYFDVSIEDFAYDHIILSREFEEDITDIPASWATGEVLDAMAQNLVPAELQSDYAIGITRAEFSKLIVQLLREKGVKVTLDPKVKFNDTNDPDVLEAASAGIVSGVGGGKFNPNALITREQAATMLARAADVLGIKGSSPMEFSDMNRASGWAKDYIKQVSSIVSEGNRRVMGGVGNGFDPQGSYTRQQAILTVVRLANCK